MIAGVPKSAKTGSSSAVQSYDLEIETFLNDDNILSQEAKISLIFLNQLSSTKCFVRLMTHPLTFFKPESGL
jgi:hypothetical protein